MFEALSAWRAFTSFTSEAFRVLGGGDAYSRYRARKERRRGRAEVDLVRESSLFDAAWYLENYADVRRAGVDPLLHFTEAGWREGRDPSPHFSTSAYLKANADVARSGINPLCHYIQFGHNEGRETFGRRPTLPVWTTTAFSFGKPAECASFPLKDEAPVRWCRSHRLDRRHPRAIEIGGTLLGYTAHPSIEKSVRNAFDALSQLSGYGEPPSCGGSADFSDPAKLVDAWFVNSAQLRTRWSSSKQPFVIRAFQHDPLQAGAVSLAGEGLVTSSLDVVDFHLTNPYFPILFVLAEPDASLRGSRMLAFPSLCRGGAHYPELLRSAVGADCEVAVDPIYQGDRLAERLIRLRNGDAQSAVAAIVVDVEAADGRSQLFQPDFQHWMQKVVQIGAAPVTRNQYSTTEEFLSRAVAVGAPRRTSKDSGTLIVNHDMIPTIEALSEPARSEIAASEIFVPLLVTGAQPTQSVALFEMPSETVSILKGLAIGNPKKWPRLQAGRNGKIPERFPVAAIRSAANQDLADIEVLAPTTQSELVSQFNYRQPITWLIEPEVWEAKLLGRSLEALALQKGASMDHVALIGRVPRRTISKANEVFDGRATSYTTMTEAVKNVPTEVIGLLGSGVILHDIRTAASLSSLLKDERVATASCPLISVEGSGSAWRASVSDLGSLNTPWEPGRVLESGFVVEQLWRSSYVVATPPEDLWVVGVSRLAEWLNQSESVEISDGVHVCCGLVTASQLNRPERPNRRLLIPRISDKAVRVEVLFG